MDDDLLHVPEGMELFKAYTRFLGSSITFYSYDYNGCIESHFESGYAFAWFQSDTDQLPYKVRVSRDNKHKAFVWIGTHRLRWGCEVECTPEPPFHHFTLCFDDLTQATMFKMLFS